MLEVTLLDKAIPGSRAPGVEVDHVQLHLCGCLREVHLYFKDVTRLTMLRLFGKANATGIVVEESG